MGVQPAQGCLLSAPNVRWEEQGQLKYLLEQHILADCIGDPKQARVQYGRAGKHSGRNFTNPSHTQAGLPEDR